MLLTLHAPLVLTLLLSIQHPSTSDGWKPIFKSQQEGVDLEWKSRASEPGFQVQFKNAGTTVLHFRFHLVGVPDDSDANGGQRVHLEVGGRAIFLVPAEPTKVRVYEVRSGDGDEGPNLDK